MKPKHPLRLLLVEDHEDISQNIADYFESKGHILDFAANGIQGLHLALTQDYDVMILDIMLPGMDGLTLCKRFRESSARQIPILMLTARDTLPDKIDGFDAGTDDYLVKPFALQELEVRVYALARRELPDMKSILIVGDLELNLETMEVKRADRKIDLNRACLKILEQLMKASPGVVTRSDLELALWGDMPPGSDSLRSHMYMLRKKIDTPFSEPLIQTIHGTGYKLVMSNEISL
ncbi:MAG: DNA-binding response regulator [Desulfobacteraceae bacterium]|nr:MAG: DNA-binding response regulator [Desulfobacteraceae bacterium]